MAAKSKGKEGFDFEAATKLLEEHWQVVITEAAEKPDLDFIPDKALRDSIHDSINHALVSYRFCLPVQLLGKMVNPVLDCLRLQKSDPEDRTG
jgi:hypothetical protein